jgi:arylsulfatase A-like enzyme
VVPDVVANVDVWPTLLDLFGLPPMDGVDGQSLMPLIRAAAKGEASGFDRPAFAQIDRTWGRPTMDPDPLVSVTKGSLRAFQATAEGKTGNAELYDHATDPWEKENLATEDGSGGKKLPPELAELVKGYVAQPAVAWGAPVDVQLNEMELNQLRALGYVVK